MNDLPEFENASSASVIDFCGPTSPSSTNTVLQTALVVSSNTKSDSSAPDKSTTPCDVVRPSTSRKTPDRSQPCTENFVSPKDFRPILKAGPRNIICKRPKEIWQKYDRN